MGNKMAGSWTWGRASIFSVRNRGPATPPWQRSSGRRYAPAYNGPAVYYGDYGRPDVVYSSAYERHGHDHREYGQGGRSQQRINWCCAEYRSYDPATGYYIAYSGRQVFCG